ncbi:MAG: hypothetical protein CL693_17710 [Cellvibrionaceae bacterium]|nr:hypothetical protein [Cellvibrionaceae bacterium]|tara:strand:- start:8031 stop:8882 length:852 start_codon:yes stop_codon:yes gene_type:complete
MNTRSALPNSQQKLWLGFVLLGYALFCLGLTFYLSHYRPLQLPIAPTKPELRDTEPEPRKEAHVDIKAMKQAFFNQLLPAIRQQNAEVQSHRQGLLSLQASVSASQPLTPQQQGRLHSLAIQYRVPVAMNDDAILNELLQRVDEVPASMILAQAAIESAWGRSRFAKQANNYFGQWCFAEGCGIVPKHRNPGANHEVAKFESLDDAIAAYLRNINSHPAYAEVRQRRDQTRRLEQPLNSLEMIKGLEQYSARGQDYISELKSMIEFNQLQRFDRENADLASER